MKVEFTGRQTEVPASIRALAERKLEKLALVLPGITRAHVVVTADKRRQIAEVTVHSKKIELTAESLSSDLAVSVSDAMEKLLRQAKHYVGKRRERKRDGSRRKPLGAAASRLDRSLQPGPSVPRVVKSRRFAVKPMTLDEAALEVTSRAAGFLVFRDARTERLSVLYRRQDGNLGLIDPEA
jgi:putative sigma-54 modulation protein